MFNHLVGQVLDRYQLVRQLGEGELGAMFLAYDPNLQRDVALKVLDTRELGGPNAAERVLERARAAARLDHPGLVKVHDFGRSESLMYIVMEYLAGGNLRQLLSDLRQANQWLPLSEAVELTRQLALVLDYVSRQGEAPRRVRPTDIMFKPEPSGGLPYRPVLTDLGLEELRQQDWQPPAEGAARPAYAYWSPEQALGEPIDMRSQVYSLGILLYELSVGWQPFPAQTMAEAVRAHTRSDPPPPRARRADLPAPLEGIILKALQKDPAQRYPDPAALAQALEDVLPLARETRPGDWEVSLMVPYQRGLRSGPSVPPMATMPLVEPSLPAEPTVNLNQARIRVVSPTGQTRYAAFTGRGLTIGREPGNDLVLDDAAVSSQHARIEFDGQTYRVVDLNSQNGTFLGGVRLLPGMPEPWRPDAPLLVGDTWLHLELPAAAARPNVFRFDGVTVDANLIQTSANGNVGVYVEVPQLAVTPGQPSTVGIIVVNKGPSADRFSISLNGVPPNWIVPPGPPTSVALQPGAHQRLKITIQPPRTPGSRAGRAALVLRAASQSAPDQFVEGRVTLAVAAFSQFASELNTPALRVNVPARVSVQNQGNTQETYTIDFEDPEQALSFNPPGIALTVPEGQVGPADFSAALQRPRIIGGQQSHPFTVRVTSRSGQVQRHNAELLSSGMVPPWLPLLLLLVGCLLTSVAAFAYADFNNRNATRTAVAQQAAVAQTATALAATAGTALTPIVEISATPTATPTASETFMPLTPTLTPDLATATPSQTNTPSLATATQTGTPVVIVVTATPGPTDTASPTATLVPATATVTPTLTQVPLPPSTPGFLVFESRRDGNPEVYIANGNGETQARLTNTTTGGNNSSAPVWSQAAGLLAFQTNRDGQWEIYSMNPDGSGQTLLSDDSASDTEPAWSPNGERIAFVSDRDGNPEIYVMNADGSDQTRLTDTPAGEFRPQWAPSGNRIAFESERDGNREIYIMNADGSDETRLTNNAATDAGIAWSPSGALIVFVSDRDTNNEIYLMNADGSGQNRLTNAPGSDAGPVWSPNGARIAFVSQRDGNPEIYVMNADGSLQQRLTNHPAVDSFPVWSPDNSSLAFMSERDGNAEIYSLNAAGGAPVRLTNNSAYDAPILWRP